VGAEGKAAEGKAAEGKATAVVAAARGGVELLREGRAVTEDQLIAQLRNSFVSDLGYAEQHRTSQDAASTVGAAASTAVSAFQAPSLGPIYIGGGASDADAALKRNALSSLLSMRAKEIEATQREQCVKTSRQLVSAYQQQVARLQAALAERLPGKPFTQDQLLLLQKDNVVAAGALGLSALGITARPIEAVVPAYLTRFKAGGGRRE
jgi:uncharacterized protein